MDTAALVIDPDLIRKYDHNGPRYTSYPTADRFVDAFGDAELRQWLGRPGAGGAAQPLSVYVHLPFCDTLCYYCACNKVITRDRSKAQTYIAYLRRELEMAAGLLGGARTVCQLHWGGGTPTFLTREQMSELMAALDAEYSIEIDPRRAEPGTMEFLAGLGFNRVSLGVQDFDPQVQQAVHRIQSFELTRRVVEEARAAGLRSLNFDLIYGLPKQTLESFDRTLDQVLELAPERIALYSYAHLPTIFKPQRRIAVVELPPAAAKLDIMSLAIRRLQRAGYVYIGMDHFARPDDPLAVAQREGGLQRNFQGYSTCPETDMLALGVSAIGRIGPTYYQNAKGLEAYYLALDEGRLPTVRGIELAADDLVRRAVIQALACGGPLSFPAIERAHGIDFRRYFAAELDEMRRFALEGLVELAPDAIRVRPKGRLLLRPICMVFDRYLREREARASYSKVI
jgi:oxygen-independent coproporphyrinogen-3 oxidase